MIVNFLVCLYFFLNALACSTTGSGGKSITLLVNHYRVPCTGVGSQLCYLVKKDNAADWEFLYEGIDGFTYEWGKDYELQVEEIKNKKPVADQPPISYRLIKIVSANDAPEDAVFQLVIKDSEMKAIQKTDDGMSLLGQYPVRCDQPQLCNELERRLSSDPKVTCRFSHASDRRAIVLQSIED